MSNEFPHDLQLRVVDGDDHFQLLHNILYLFLKLALLDYISSWQFKRSSTALLKVDLPSHVNPVPELLELVSLLLFLEFIY